MEKRTFETIIVGGGVSGLSCARRLHDAGRDFLLITKNIGGRMLASKKFEVNYGAAYVTEDYTNLLNYVELLNPFKLREFYFYDGERFRNLFSPENFLNFPKMLKFLLILRNFRKHWLMYRNQAPRRSIGECFQSDPVLMKYWNMPATEFIQRHGFEKLDELYGNPITYTTAFTESSNVNTVYYLGVFFPCILKTWKINIQPAISKMTAGYEGNIRRGAVLKVRRDDAGLYNVQSTIGHFTAKNIVFAAPQKSLSNVYNLPAPHLQQRANVFHLSGKRKAIFQDKKMVIFRPGRFDVSMIWQQNNEEDIIYATHSMPDFTQYYTKHRVIKRIHWNPGMVIPKGNFVEQKIGKNIYIASDYNLSLLEDSFLTGLYAANQIIDPA